MFLQFGHFGFLDTLLSLRWSPDCFFQLCNLRLCLVDTRDRKHHLFLQFCHFALVGLPAIFDQLKISASAALLLDVFFLRRSPGISQLTVPRGATTPQHKLGLRMRQLVRPPLRLRALALRAASLLRGASLLRPENARPQISARLEPVRACLPGLSSPHTCGIRRGFDVPQGLHVHCFIPLLLPLSTDPANSNASTCCASACLAASFLAPFDNFSVNDILKSRMIPITLESCNKQNT